MIALLISVAAAFVLSILGTPLLIRVLRRRGIGQLIRDKGSLNGPPEYTTITYGSFGGGGGDQMANPVFDANTGALQGGRTQGVTRTVNAAKFISAVKDQFSDFVHTQFGAVDVGQPVGVSNGSQHVPTAEKKP